MSEHLDAEYLKEGGSPEPEPHRAAADDQPDFGGDQPSAAGSGGTVSETSQGGADAVPDTPDDVAETYVGETDATRRSGE